MTECCHIHVPRDSKIDSHYTHYMDRNISRYSVWDQKQKHVTIEVYVTLPYTPETPECEYECGWLP